MMSKYLCVQSRVGGWADAQALDFRIWGPLLVNEKPHSTVTVTHDILRSVDPVPEARRGRGGGGVGRDS